MSKTVGRLFVISIFAIGTIFMLGVFQMFQAYLNVANYNVKDRAYKEISQNWEEAKYNKGYLTTLVRTEFDSRSLEVLGVADMSYFDSDYTDEIRVVVKDDNNVYNYLIVKDGNIIEKSGYVDDSYYYEKYFAEMYQYRH